jgi:hypothetical protein
VRAPLYFIVMALAAGACNAAAAAPDDGFPVTMPNTFIECEGSGPCDGLWTFAGLHGHGRWPKAGTDAALTVVRFSEERIVIKRVDTSNPGFSAEYVAALNGDTLNGSVTWSWPGHWAKPKTGVFHATVNDSLMLPTIIARAVAPSPKRFNLNGAWKSSNPAWLGAGALPDLRIIQNEDRVQITAMDATSGFETLRYDGKFAGGAVNGRLSSVADDADSAVTGVPPTPTWSPLSLTVKNPDLIAVPDGYLYRVSEPGPDDALCDAADRSHMTAPYAYDRGLATFRAREDYALAACWFRIAASHGHPRSQAILAMMLDEGYPGVPRDVQGAFRWAKLSAAQDDYHGEFELANLYRAGRGTPANHDLADSWERKAQNDAGASSPARGQNTANVGGLIVGAMAAGFLFGAFL